MDILKCIQDTFLKKEEIHSSKLNNDNKIIAKKDEEVLFLRNFNEYYYLVFKS